MPTSSNNNRRKSIAVAPNGENGPINRASPSVRFDKEFTSKRRESLPALAIGNNYHSNNNNNNNNNNSAVTPGKKPSSKKSNGGGDHDVVLAYHFKDVRGTPFSTKKRKTPGLKNNNQQHPGDVVSGGRISQEMKRSRTEDAATTANNSNALNDTFNMGGNTADINSVLYAASSAGYDANESMMSMESKSSSVGESSTASSDMDALNVTTLSDTHEYTASSFIQATKYRNVLDERAKSFRAEAEAAKKKKKKEEEAAAAEAAQTEPSATLELEDLTLNLGGGGGDLTQNVTQSLGGLLSDIKQKQNFAKSIQEEEEDGVDDEIEFTSHQKSRTPSKIDVRDETKSVGHLDELLAESESFIEEDERQSSFVESTASGNQLNGILGDSPADANNSSIARASPSSLCPSPSVRKVSEQKRKQPKRRRRKRRRQQQQRPHRLSHRPRWSWKILLSILVEVVVT